MSSYVNGNLHLIIIYFTYKPYSNLMLFLYFFWQCFVFHLYKGVRAGGGIGDEIGEPDGDDYEVYRIMFDITFFFFVIVILLAIIQGEYSWMIPQLTGERKSERKKENDIISRLILRSDHWRVWWTSRSARKREDKYGKQLLHMRFRKGIFRRGAAWVRYSRAARA